MSDEHEFAVGDVVRLSLPLNPLGHWTDVAGTVLAMDLPDVPPGLQLRIHHPNARSPCYATRRECTFVDHPHPPANPTEDTPP